VPTSAATDAEKRAAATRGKRDLPDKSPKAKKGSDAFVARLMMRSEKKPVVA
jgi:hypothetical protein